MKCVQFFRSFLPSVENSLENCNILPFGRTRFSFENREREKPLWRFRRSFIPYSFELDESFIRCTPSQYVAFSCGTMLPAILQFSLTNICNTKFMKFINYRFIPYFPSLPAMISIIVQLIFPFWVKLRKDLPMNKGKKFQFYFERLMTVIIDNTRIHFHELYYQASCRKFKKKKNRSSLHKGRVSTRTSHLISSLRRIRIARPPIPISERNTLKE